MNKKIIETLKIIIVALVLAVGGTYAYAVWTNAPGTPPTCPTEYPGCDAPVNVSGAAQVKTGGLGIGGFFSAKGKTVIGHGEAAPSIADSLKLKIFGRVGAEAYCDQNGENCSTPPFGGIGSSPQWWGQVGDTGRIENLNPGRVEINGKVKIAGGHPGVDKVLASTDETGVAKWKSLAELGAIQGFTASCGSGKAISSININTGQVTCVTVPNGSSGGGNIIQFLFGGGSGGGSPGQCYESTGSCRTGYYRAATIPGQYSCRNVLGYRLSPGGQCSATGNPVYGSCTYQACSADDTVYQCCPR